MNYYDSNLCYDSNYSGFDQIEPSEYSVNQPLNIQNELDHHELFINELIQQKLQNEYAQPFLAIAITFDLPNVEPKDSLRIRDEHLYTILEMKSDEFIKSSVKDLLPSPSESEDDSECDVPACDDFTTFSNILFDVDDDFSSSDNESFFDEDISKEIYSNPLFDEEINSMKIYPHHFNAESDLIESLLNHDSSIISSSSSKIDFLLDEFTGEIILFKSIPLGIDETDCDPKEEIRLIEKLVYDNSSLSPPEEFISENSDAAIESFSPSPIPIEDMDMLILEKLLRNDSSLLENELFDFDISSSSRPHAKPPDDDKIEPNPGILTVKVVGGISEHNVHMPRLLPTQPTLVSNQEKSPHLLSHQGFKAFQLPSESPMIIYGGNNPILDRCCEAFPPVKGALATSGFELLSRCTMPKSIHLDHHDTTHYILMYHRTGGFTEPEREVHKYLVSCLFHVGRTIESTFLDDQPNLRPTFASIGFDFLLDINETICPIFVIQFYKSVRLIRIDTILDPFQMIVSDLKFEFKKWEVILGENTVSLTKNKDHPNACLCYMLYCLAIGKPFNLAYYIANRMKRVFRFKDKGKKPRLPTPTPSNSKSSDLPSPNPNQEREKDPVHNFTLDLIPYMDQLPPIKGGESP
nr:hypothetical protein [Tanacetum cinerariifolium]